MIHYINKNKRIKLKFYLPALGRVLALQRKRWYGWRTVSWIYPHIMQNDSSQYIIEWLEWRETYKAKTNINIGHEIMAKFKTDELHNDKRHLQ